MAIVQAFCTSFKKQLLEAVHDFRVTGGDTFKLALYTESANLNSSTTIYSTVGEISGLGYAAGGITLTNIEPSQYNLAGVCSFNTATWTSSSLSARGGLIYNSTPSHTYTNPSCLVLDFGTTRFSVNGSFQIRFPQITDLSAIVRIN